jgi:peptidyl-prolyl cis-trans isomerase C
MEKFQIRLLAIAFSALLLSSGLQAEEIVATVNGKKITREQLDYYHKYRQATSRQEVGEAKDVLQELINREILLAEVKKKKIDQNKDLNFAIEQQKHDVYIQALLRDTSVGQPIPEQEVRKIYDERVGTQKIKEYKVNHILLKSEEDAKATIAELDAGARFMEVAKRKSEGPSAGQGGELGWLNPGQLNTMPGFAQALSEMKKGSYSKAPVQTQYGWHVIQLEDQRDAEPPSFEQVQKQITAALRQQRLQEYVMQLRNAAKIDVKLK